MTPTLAKQEKNMNVHNFVIEVGADAVSLQGQAILLIEVRKFTKAVEVDGDMRPVSYDD